MLYKSSKNKRCYFPPLLSNGDISFAPDAEGMIGYSLNDCKERGVQAFDGIVVRAARRSALCNSLHARLFPFGKFTFSEGSALESWSQNLEVEGGYFDSTCEYKSGAKIYSKGFIHPNMNVYALEKRFTEIDGSKQYSYDVTLVGYNPDISKYMQTLYTKFEDGICKIGFKMYGMDVICGEINFFVDKEFSAKAIENGVRITFMASNDEKVAFYYFLEDNLDKANYTAILKSYKNRIDTSGFEILLNECISHFRDFYSLGYVKTSDRSLNKIYKTSLYSIKCNTTNYSIAVGFNNGSWDGRYFAFDEYTSFIGLLGANRLTLAKRVPDYRLKECLPVAIKRGSDCHRSEDTEDTALFHWQTGESDKYELASNGCWIDHVFHMPLIGIGAYNYYEYSHDISYLKECYPMIRACAKFFTRHMIYKDSDKYYIGKCTDLERLGASAENPFMTACGAIKLFRCLGEAARVLNTDLEFAEECDFLADKLFENLPSENGMYVPLLNCKQKSIAVFSGKFPFEVLSDSDNKMLRAWADFEENGAAYGNMYPRGKSISPWYACWKAEGYARAKLADKAYESLTQSYSSAGVFGEMFEINEEDVCLRPWFSTAAGIFVSTINDMLLQSDGKTIRILPAFPHSIDVSFKLAAKGGVTVEAVVENAKLVKVLIEKDGKDVTNEFNVEF